MLRLNEGTIYRLLLVRLAAIDEAVWPPVLRLAARPMEEYRAGQSVDQFVDVANKAVEELPMRPAEARRLRHTQYRHEAVQATPVS